MALWKAGLKGSYIVAEGSMAWIMPRLHLLQGYILPWAYPSHHKLDGEQSTVMIFMGSQGFSRMRSLSTRIAGRES